VTASAEIDMTAVVCIQRLAMRGSSLLAGAASSLARLPPAG
jgi:hypothetical protein